MSPLTNLDPIIGLVHQQELRSLFPSKDIYNLGSIIGLEYHLSLPLKIVALSLTQMQALITPRLGLE